MGLLDKFTGKKEDTKKKATPKKKKDADVLDMVKDDAAKSEPVKLKEDTKHAHKVLLTYHLSEKTNTFAQNGRYVFKVALNANKIEVKKAIESVYDVHVVDVNMIKIPGKTRRMGRAFGRTSNIKKAIVTLKQGEKIAGLSEGV